MIKVKRWMGLPLILILLSGCISAPTAEPASHEPPTPAANLTTIPAQPTLIEPTQIPVTQTVPTATPTLSATATAAQATSTPADASQTTPADYLDDRSTPAELVLSLYNAISRFEYLRAYSYWEDPQDNPQVGSFDSYQAGFSDTLSVQVTLGAITGDAGAGQRYYSVPVLLQSTSNSGQVKNYAGCYVLHLGSPDIQAVPPFRPLSIQSATLNPVDQVSNADALLASACDNPGNPEDVPTSDPNDISVNNYLDDRSDAIQTLRSLFNAINRKEYVRAYSYWMGTSSVQPFDQFQQGYAKTTAVQATFGQVSDDVGAGQMRYRVPVMLTAQTTDGKTQYFSGCYQLHLSQPSFQATPPFQPMGIEKAWVQVETSLASAKDHLATACQNVQ